MATKKGKRGVYRCIESGSTNYVVRITETTPKLKMKYCPVLRKRSEHKLYDKTK